MFRLPSKSKYANVNHKKAFSILITKHCKGLDPEQKKRLSQELDSIEKHNLHSLFLLLYEIANLLRANSFKFCGAKPLVFSFAAYLLEISNINGFNLSSDPDEFYKNYEVKMGAYDLNVGQMLLNKGDMDQKTFEHHYGSINQGSNFFVPREQDIEIIMMLQEYYSYGNIAKTIGPGPHRSKHTGFTEFSTACHPYAFLPDNICQSNRITLKFPTELFVLTPTIECLSSKCAFFGIVNVGIHGSKQLTSQTGKNDDKSLKQIGLAY